MKRLVIVFAVLLLGWMPSRAEVFIGFQEGISSVDVSGGMVCLPVFLENVRGKRLSIRRNGKYCDLSHLNLTSVSGMFILTCDWKDVYSDLLLPVNGSSFYNVVMCWGYDGPREDLQICLDDNCTSASYTLNAGEAPNSVDNTTTVVSSGSDQGGEAEFISLLSGSTAGGASNSVANESSSNTVSSSDFSSGGDLISLASSLFGGSGASLHVYNPQETQECKASYLKLSSSRVALDLVANSTGERTVYIEDNCGNLQRPACVELAVGSDSITLGSDSRSVNNWLSVSYSNGRIKLSFRAPEEEGRYEEKLKITLCSESDLGFRGGAAELSVVINVSGQTGASGGYVSGRCNRLNAWCYRPLYMPANSTAYFYFYGCTWDASREHNYARLVVSVEESSYYHDGHIKPILRFLGDRKPTSVEDFPSWEDFYALKSYADTYWPQRANAYCPNRYEYMDPEGYGGMGSTWIGFDDRGLSRYGAKYRDYYYCIHNLLTRYLEVYKSGKTCGWWALTLFNDDNMGRELLRLGVFVVEPDQNDPGRVNYDGKLYNFRP